MTPLTLLLTVLLALGPTLALVVGMAVWGVRP